MPPLPNVPKVLKVRLSGHFATAVPWAVLDHWRYMGVTPANTDLDQFAAAIDVAYGANMVQVFADDVLMNLVEVIDLTSPTAAVGSIGTTRPGTAGSLNIADSVCVLESKKGALHYRGGHSRTYWPQLGAAGANATGNSWGAPQIQAFENALGQYLDSIIGDAAGRIFGPVQRSIVHYKGSHPSITYPFVEDVLTSNTSPAFASQRRRLGR